MEWSKVESLSELNKTQLVFLVMERDKKIGLINQEVHYQKESQEEIHSLKEINGELEQKIKNYKTNEKLRELKIADMAVEIKTLKYPPVPLHKKPLHDIFIKFLEDKCELKDHVSCASCPSGLAPTNFMDICFEFKTWFDQMDLVGRVKGHNDRKLLKGFMMEAQEQSKYGLEIGNHMKDGCKNGTARNLYVNFVCKDED